KLGGALEVAVGGQIDALALDRLDHKGGGRPRSQCILERTKIVERDACAAGQQRLEARAKSPVALERQCAPGNTVEGMIAIDDAWPSGPGASELDRRFDRLRP